MHEGLYFLKFVFMHEITVRVLVEIKSVGLLPYPATHRHLGLNFFGYAAVGVNTDSLLRVMRRM
jgi:hypothetical protein